MLQGNTVLRKQPSFFRGGTAISKAFYLLRGLPPAVTARTSKDVNDISLWHGLARNKQLKLQLYYNDYDDCLMQSYMVLRNDRWLSSGIHDSDQRNTWPSMNFDLIPECWPSLLEVPLIWDTSGVVRASPDCLSQLDAWVPSWDGLRFYLSCIASIFRVSDNLPGQNVAH